MDLLSLFYLSCAIAAIVAALLWKVIFMSHPEETTTMAAEPAGHSRNRNISLTHRRHCHYTHRHGGTEAWHCPETARVAV